MMEETLPGTANDDDPDSIVLHVDMDCFYAAYEHLCEPELEGEPVVVDMSYESGEGHGAVTTAGYEAREFGVDSAQPVSTALERLPRIDDLGPSDGPTAVDHYRTVDLEFYKSVAADVRAILHDYTDVVREASIDEAYLDVTNQTAQDLAASGDRTLAKGFTHYMRQCIAREVGVAASVGVAPSMSTVRIASGFDRPDGLIVVHPGEVRPFLAPISVKEVHGVGPVMAQKLGSLGIETAGDLADTGAAVLEAEFGSRGRELHKRTRGYDDRAVTPTGRPRSLSQGSAFTDPTDDIKDKREVVRALAADVANRARSCRAMCRTIGIKVIVPPFDINTRATSLSGPVDGPKLVESAALDLLDVELTKTTVRRLDVCVSKLSFVDADQSNPDGQESAEAGETGGDGDERVSDEPPSTDGEAPLRGGQSSPVKFD